MNDKIDSELLDKLGWQNDVDDMGVYYFKGPFTGYFDNEFVVFANKPIVTTVTTLSKKKHVCSSVHELYAYIKEYYDILIKKKQEECQSIIDAYEMLNKENENLK